MHEFLLVIACSDFLLLLISGSHFGSCGHCLLSALHICPTIGPGFLSLPPSAPLTLGEIFATKDLRMTIGRVGGPLDQHSKSVNTRYWAALFLEGPQPHLSPVPFLSLSCLTSNQLVQFPWFCPLPFLPLGFPQKLKVLPTLHAEQFLSSVMP